MKPTNEQKALAACREYVRAQGEIKRLTNLIADAMHKCWLVEFEKHGPGWSADEAVRYVPHLRRAYETDIDDFGHIQYPDAESIAESFAPCIHCQAAHQAIQERKKARQSFGAAKRQITKLGKV